MLNEAALLAARKDQTSITMDDLYGEIVYHTVTYYVDGSIDTIDSKFRVLGEELEKTESETYTDSIGVLDKTKIWKK